MHWKEIINVLKHAILYHHHLFNDRLQQRDLGNYKTNLHQIFRDGRYVGVGVQSGIGFRIGQGTLPCVAMATNFRREIGRNRRHAFILGTRVPQRMAGWESGWAR